jgi:hypothetical protein
MTSGPYINPNLRLPLPTASSGIYSSHGSYVSVTSPTAESMRSSSSGSSSPATTPLHLNLPSLNLANNHAVQSSLHEPKPSLGPLAAAVTLPPLPKAGRKPLTTPPKDSRQRQNREAQRTYRRNQREEMQTLRDKESQWIRTAREGQVVIEDFLRATDTMPPELRQRLPTYSLERLYDDLSKYTGDASVSPSHSPTSQSAFFDGSRE